MKGLFFALTILTSIISSAQMVQIKGRVIDENGSGIPFAVCHLKLNTGFYCSDDGSFDFKCSIDSITKLRFCCVGYECKELLIDDLQLEQIKVQLKVKPNELKEVAVIANARKMKRSILGKKRLKPNGQSYMRIGDECAIFLKAIPQTNGYLEKVNIYILKQGKPESKFRVHIYDVDTSGFPGEDITGTNIIANGTTGDEWVTIDMSKYNVPLGSGIFVSVETIAGYGNDESLQTIGTSTIIQGQVLALTTSYGNVALNYRRRMYGKWGIFPYPLNPAIYCTYRY